MDLTAPLQVVDPTVETVELVKDAKMLEGIRKAVIAYTMLPATPVTPGASPEPLTHGI